MDLTRPKPKSKKQNYVESKDDSNTKIENNHSDGLNTIFHPSDPLENSKMIDDIPNYNEKKGNKTLRSSVNNLDDESYRTEGRLIEDGQYFSRPQTRIVPLDNISSQDESISVEDKEIKSIPDIKEIEALNGGDTDRTISNQQKDK